MVLGVFQINVRVPQAATTFEDSVVLEAGISATICNWQLIQPEIAKFTRVLSYDRAGEQAVARILQDTSLVRLDDRCEALERGVHDGVDILGIEPPAESRGLHHVREQQRHWLELLLGVTKSGELGAQGGERRIDYRVAEDGAL